MKLTEDERLKMSLATIAQTRAEAEAEFAQERVRIREQARAEGAAQEREAIRTRVERLHDTASLGLRDVLEDLLAFIRAQGEAPMCHVCVGDQHPGGCCNSDECPDCAPKPDARELALEALRGIVAWSETVTTSHEVDALIAAARAAILALEGTSAKQKP